MKIPSSCDAENHKRETVAVDPARPRQSREWLPWCSGMMDSMRHQDTVRLNLWLKYNGKDLPRYLKHFIIQHFYLNYEVCLSGWTEISVFSGYEIQNGVTFRLQVPVRWLHSRMHPDCRVGCVPLGPLVSAISSGNSKEPASHVNSDPLLILLGTTHKQTTGLLQGRGQRSIFCFNFQLSLSKWKKITFYHILIKL